MKRGEIEKKEKVKKIRTDAWTEMEARKERMAEEEEEIRGRGGE